MTRILILTRAFPYLPGEEFVEPEAPFWQREGVDVVVMPWRVQGDPRPLPEGVEVSTALADITAAQRRRARLRAVAHPLLWREVGWLAAHRRLNRATATESLRGVSGALVMRDALATWLQANGPVDLVYGYWWDVWTHAAVLLRGHGVRHVVSRAHGYDLYESRHPSGFLSLKRILGPRLDALLALSPTGRDAAMAYGLAADQVWLAPLGVALPSGGAATSPAGELHLVSTASFTQVKRVDRLVAGLDELCRSHPELRVHWTHFGDGPLRAQLEEQLAAVEHPNLHVTLRGNVPNAQVREHLASQPVDLFVNTSESEGVPVSIMEAMAFGVPSLAPAVGGIGDIVPAQGPGGALLPAEPTPGQVAQALWQWRERAKQADERAAARAVVEQGYDQDTNHRRLMDRLVALARS